jgi:hypothetical protein
MGKYLNPPLEHDHQTAEVAKRIFLEEHGTLLTKYQFDNMIVNEDSKIIPVCRVDNIVFTAVLIADTQSEIDYIRDNPDSRPKTYYSLKREVLLPYL